MAAPTILLTGFEPFAGDRINPSAEVAQALDGERLGPWQVQSRVLPCEFGRSLHVLRQALEAQRPGLVLCLGQAGGRDGITVEKLAVNLDDARIPDNAGAQPCDRPVHPGAPAARFARLPVKAMVAALRAEGLPASVSLSAGSFVCNHVFFGLLQALARRRSVQAGFVHLPWLPEQLAGRAPAPSLALADQVRGVRCLLATAAAWRGRGDLSQAGGELH